MEECEEKMSIISENAEEIAYSVTLSITVDDALNSTRS
jgi:hypothetical protein